MISSGFFMGSIFFWVSGSGDLSGIFEVEKTTGVWGKDKSQPPSNYVEGVCEQY